MSRHPALLAAAALAAALAAPATATADSIVYVDGGNVWSSQPDGSSKVQLTDGGRWHSPTQADDGTIAAVDGVGPITVMARDGRPLRTITTPPAKSGDGGTFAPRPVDLSLSPDGSKIAYAYYQYSCPVASSCGTIQRSTFYTRADVTEATPHAVWGNQFGVADPEWITNDRALVHGGSGSQVSIDDLGGGDYSFVNWIKPNADQGDGELTRDGRRLATTFFHGDETVIAFFAVKGDPRTETPPAQPDVACNLDPADAAFGDPSWSPDGSTLAFESKAGIETLSFTKLAADGCETTGPSRVVHATGSEPDWGPAEPPAARWTPPAPNPGGEKDPRTGPAGPAGPTPGGGDDPKSGPAGERPQSLTAGGAARQRFRGTVTVTCASPVATRCTATVRVKAGRRTHRATASAPVRAGGKATLRVRFGKAARRAIGRALRRGPIRATARLEPGAGSAVAGASRTVRLRR